jgi:hypothetical protein
MKKRVFFLLLPLWLSVGSNSLASNVDIGINVNIGAPALVIASPPEFLLIPALGLHVSIGAPYDLFYLDGYYYQFHKNRWYRSNHYQGPWGYVERGKLPKRFHKHEYRQMLERRDRDYREYQKDKGKYRDRYYRADDKGGREKERGDDDHPGKSKDKNKDKSKGKHGGKD